MCLLFVWTPSETGDDKYVVFVSGLSVGSIVSNPLHSQLFVDHITGHLGDDKVQTILICYFAYL